MIKLGKKLRKNGVALDVIILGAVDDEERKAALSKLVETANKDENSHFLSFGGGLVPLAESVRNSLILFGNE